MRNDFTEVTKGCFIHNDYLELFNKMQLIDLESFEKFESGERLVKANLDSYRKRLRFLSEDGRCFYLKFYKNAPLKKQLINWLDHREYKSMGEFDMGPVGILEAANIQTPKVVAFGSEWSGLVERRSFVVTEQIAGEALERKLPRFLLEPERDGNLEKKMKFIHELADFARRFHKTGLRHRDFYLAHLFWDKKEGLRLIDLFRVFRPVQSLRYQIKDLAQLYYSSPGSVFSSADKLRFYKSYNEVAVLSSNDKKLIRRIVNKAVKMAKHDRRRGRRVPFEN